jgi:hypothetical protein
VSPTKEARDYHKHHAKLCWRDGATHACLGQEGDQLEETGEREQDRVTDKRADQSLCATITGLTTSPPKSTASREAQRSTWSSR